MGVYLRKTTVSNRKTLRGTKMNISRLGRKALTQIIARRRARQAGKDRTSIKIAGIYARELLNQGHSAARAIALTEKLSLNGETPCKTASN